MKKLCEKTLWPALLVGALIISVNINAGTYVSFRGGFFIAYPEDWVQVPYLTADVFLSQMGTDQSALDYEAVFAPKTSNPFFATDYLILALDSVEWLYDYQMDSVVDEMKKSFGEDVEYFQIEELPSEFRSKKPVYDKNKKLITVVNDILAGDKIVRKNLTAKKFYDKGVANFYFYSLDSLFEKSRPLFEGIVNSFSTENVQQAIPKEEVRVSDGKSDKKIDWRKIFIPGGGVFIILMILAIRRLRAKRAKKQAENS